MTYDCIFCGFGLSTMLLLDAFNEYGLLADRSVLILEQAEELQAKTWCFWERGAGKWDALLTRSWSEGYFVNEKTAKEILGGLTYKCMASATLRKHIEQKLNAFPNVVVKKETVANWLDDGTTVHVKTADNSYHCHKFFNAGLQQPIDYGSSKVLLQHFEGWFIKAQNLPFNPDQALIMDFTVPQQGNTRFVYVLPFSKQEALVEYTLFSPELIAPDAYGVAIRAYLEQKGVSDFEVLKKETGVIPMTAHPFWSQNTKNVLHLGTAGGWTKASTGYTFPTAQKMCERLAKLMASGNVDGREFYKTTRFHWYDRLFVSVLFDENARGKDIFTRLFTRTKPPKVLSFLKEETHILDELAILSACPKMPFLRALFRWFK